MSFQDTLFLFTYIPVMLVYGYAVRRWGTDRRVSSGILIVANLVFYIFAGFRILLFILLYALITYCLAFLLCRFKNKVLIVFSCMMIIAPLVFVKSYGHSFVIPLGISFFTFEAFSLLMDIYRGKITECPTVLEVILYLTFFPTVSSGPILRFSSFNEGLNGDALCTASLQKGCLRFIKGLSKKLLVADKIAPVADWFFNGIAAGEMCSSIGLWVGSVAYTLQIYFDFSGYSDMAVGLGEIMGFNIPDNFDRPYTAVSISDFWKRWHISLTLWFRDYIYIPLGGNRCSIPRHLINMMIVWLLTGIWHGSDITFIIWGTAYCVLLIVEKYVKGFKELLENKMRVLGHIYTLFFVNFLWIAFRCSDADSWFRYLKGMFIWNSGKVCEDIVYRYIPYFIVLVLVWILYELGRKYREKLNRNRVWIIGSHIVALMAYVLCVCVSINSSYTPYVYGKF